MPVLFGMEGLRNVIARLFSDIQDIPTEVLQCIMLKTWSTHLLSQLIIQQDVDAADKLGNSYYGYVEMSHTLTPMSNNTD